MTRSRTLCIASFLAGLLIGGAITINASVSPREGALASIGWNEGFFAGYFMASWQGRPANEKPRSCAAVKALAREFRKMPTWTGAKGLIGEADFSQVTHFLAILSGSALGVAGAPDCDY